MEEKQHILEALDFIPPSGLNYQDWCGVGMALKQEGFGVEVWDRWSQADLRRYHPGECARKWESFRGAPAPVTGGTIVQMAKERGFVPTWGGPGEEIGWEDFISAEREDCVVVDPNWLEGVPLPQHREWDPAGQLIAYLEALFDSSDLVGYVTGAWEKEGRFLPQSGCYDRTAGQLIEALAHCGGDLGAVLGDCNPEAGAWIRFNPLDGHGVRNDNVTRFDFALVESDEMTVEEQYAVYQELELPIAALVHSGGKSLHAIVRVDAPNYAEYQKRVDYLYSVCQKNGLKIDRQNRNPSRLSRMPGVIRGGRRQELLAVNTGKRTWAEWKEWIEAVNDDLPDIDSLKGVWDSLPPLAPPLIGGVLRQGHKLLLAGPSKAGKSFALIELAICIAEGRPWLGFPCAQGRVMYVNLELDKPSCLHRFRDVYEAMGLTPEHLEHIDVWNLRGRSAPMDKLAPKMIRRAAKRNYLAIIIDPIYKVITGDENSADQMAAFCNQFDKVASELGCAVIYCHHHSKGAQGGKRSMDRASGSGVFARDPDALLDMIELELTGGLRAQRKNNAVCALCGAALEEHGCSDRVSQDDLCSRKAALSACMDLLPGRACAALPDAIREAERRVDAVTAWRIEGTLREFPRFPALNVWFEYPVHRPDDSGALSDLEADAETPGWKKAIDARKSKSEKKADRKAEIETAFEYCAGDGTVSLASLGAYFNGEITERTIRNRLKEHGGFMVNNGIVTRKEEGK